MVIFRSLLGPRCCAGARCSGFRALAAGRSASLFDTREHAMAAQERVVAAMRDRRIAPDPPRVMAGQTVIAEAA